MLLILDKNYLENKKDGQLSEVPARECSTIQNGGLLDFRVQDGNG